MSTTDAPRPKRADALRNHQAILAAARVSFAANGPDASLEEVARHAGVGIGTLYRNFPTRQALLEALYLDEIEQLNKVAEASAALPPWEALANWFDRFVTYVGTKRALAEGLNKELQFFHNCRDVIYAAADPLFARAKAAGVVRKEATLDDAVRLIAGVAAIAFPDQEQRQRVLKMALDGLKAPAKGK